MLLQKTWSEPSSLRGHAKGVNFGTLTANLSFVPEPGELMLGGMGLLALLRRRRV